jgi:hypothetical protein
MWTVRVMAYISAAAKATALMCALEVAECDTSADARGWLLERLRRYPPGYEGRLVACLERYVATGTDTRPVDAETFDVIPRAVPVLETMRVLAEDCARAGEWLGHLAGAKEEWMLVRDLRDVARQLEGLAEGFGRRPP